MNQPVNTILTNQQLQVAIHNHDLLERLRALRGSGGGSGGGGGGDGSNAYTTAAGLQPYFRGGDSKSKFSADTNGASPDSTGVAYQFKSSDGTIVDLTSADLINSGNAGSNKGSPCPQMGITYNLLTGKKLVFIDGGNFGATAYAATDTGNTFFFGPNGGPYTIGTLFSTRITHANTCLFVMGLTKLRGWDFTIGVNDIGNATPIADTVACLELIVTTMQSTFGSDVPGMIQMLGLASGFPSVKFGAVRSKTRELIRTVTELRSGFNENILFSKGQYDATPLHFLQAGNNTGGTTLGRILANIQLGLETDKDANSYIANFVDQPNATRQNGYKTFIAEQKAAGNWDLINTFQFYSADTKDNCFNDFKLFSAGMDGTVAVDFTANNKISGDGVSKYWRTQYAMVLGDPTSYPNYFANYNDFLIGVWIVNADSPAGTLATAMGTTPTARLVIGQNASSQTTFNAHNSTPVTYPTDNKLQNDIIYLESSDGTNAYLLKDGTAVRTLAQAPTVTLSTGLVALFTRINSNPNTPASEYFNGGIRGFFVMKRTGFNIPSFVTSVRNLATNVA